MNTYGISRQGLLHKMSNTPCQDALYIKELIIESATIIIAAVSDGVGSCDHSEIGSKIAAEKAVEYCAKEYQNCTDKISLLRKSFIAAKRSISLEAKRSTYSVDQMECTLCMVILTEYEIYIGNAGDSGAIALTDSGKFVKITRQINDEDGKVFPLSITDHWEFGSAKGKFVSVLLSTDGLYNYVMSKISSDSSFNSNEGIEILNDFIGRNIIEKIKHGITKNELQKYIDSKINNLTMNIGEIYDDVTAVGLITDKYIDDKTDIRPHRLLFSKNIKKTSVKELESVFNIVTLKDIKSVDVEFNKNNLLIKPFIIGNQYSGRYELIQSDDHIRRYEDDLYTAIVYVNIGQDLLKNKAEAIAESEFNMPCIDWPKCLLYSKGKFIGYLTERYEHSCNFSDYLSNCKSIPSRIQIAFALAYIFDEFHKKNFTVGSIRETDILIHNDDSIQFSNIEPFRWIYHNLNLIPISNNKLDDITDADAIYYDRYNLSEWIFKLLTMEDNIYDNNSEYLYKDSTNIKNHIDIRLFPTFISDLFYDAFVEMNPPEESIWKDALLKYVDNHVKCCLNENHWHSDDKKCPYCELAKKHKVIK